MALYLLIEKKKEIDAAIGQLNKKKYHTLIAHHIAN